MSGSAIGKITENIKKLIMGPMDAFGAIGKKYPLKPRTGLLGKLGIMAPGDAGVGMGVARYMGFRLMTIAMGIRSMAKLRFPTYKGTKIVGYETLTGDAIGTVVKNIQRMIVGTLDAFGFIGKRYPLKKASGLLGEMGIMMPSDVGVGMGAAKYLGMRLADIAIGFMFMSKLRFPKYEGTKIVGYETMTGDAIGKVVSNIRKMIYGPLDVFGLIGKKYPLKKRGGILGEFGIMAPGDAGVGMALAKDLGKVIATTAIGYMFMAQLKFPKYEGAKIVGYETVNGDFIGKVVTNIAHMLYKPLAVFAGVGKKYPLKKAGGILGDLGIMVPGDVGYGMGLSKQMSFEIARLAIGYSYMAVSYTHLTLPTKA